MSTPWSAAFSLCKIWLNHHSPTDLFGDTSAARFRILIINAEMLCDVLPSYTFNHVAPFLWVHACTSPPPFQTGFMKSIHSIFVQILKGWSWCIICFKENPDPWCTCCIILLWKENPDPWHTCCTIFCFKENPDLWCTCGLICFKENPELWMNYLLPHFDLKKIRIHVFLSSTDAKNWVQRYCKHWSQGSCGWFEFST